MREKRLAIGVTALVALAVITALVLPLAAQTPPIAVELLTPRTGGIFTDDVDIQFRFKLSGQPRVVINSQEPSQTITARITVQPGAQFPWHTHPGPVVVNVAEGELVYVQASDCVARPYLAGTAFIDPGRGTVHTAYNPAESGATVLVATFFEVPETGPLTIPVDAPSDCTVEGGVVTPHH